MSVAEDPIEVHQIPDRGGNSLTVLTYQGYSYPDFPREAIRGVATFKAREDDVLVCAYPKSGTHWVWEMVRCLMAGTTDLPVVEKDDAMIEFIVPDDLEKLASPRPLNTHVHFEKLPRAVYDQKCKLVYVSRDPRDVSVSYFHHHKRLVQYYNYHGQWHDYFPLFLNGQVDYDSWFTYTKSWEEGIKTSDLPIFITSYEALHQDTTSELKRLSEFLGKSADQTLLTQILHKSSFSNMRTTKGGLETSEAGSPVMYRKGKVGDWKNHYTVAEWEKFDAMFEKEMAGTKAHELYSMKSKDGIYHKGIGTL